MRFTRWTASAALIATLAATPAAAQNEQATYVVAGSEGVTIRNVRDGSGIPVGECGPGMVMAVHETMNKWTQVEPAGGLTCWVWGKYLNETGVTGRYEVNKNGVNMRPMPSSGNESFPLPGRLYVGETVRMVARMDPSAPFAEDWIQIRSPQGVYGWALSSTLQPASDPAQAAETWKADWRAIMEAMGGETLTPTETTTDTTGTPKPGSEDLLVRARRMMNSSPPMYAEAKALFAELQTQVPEGGAMWVAAHNGMMQADAYTTIEALQRQLQEDRASRERGETARQAELERIRAQKTPLMGKYDSRGWVEPYRMPDGEMGWYLRFGGKDTCAIQCTSGRYELSMFAGYEVGVIGSMTNEPGAMRSTCDLRAIEVLSGRNR